MARKKAEQTLNEILEEDEKTNGKQKKGGSCVLRLLILLVLGVLLFLGFIITQQYLLDLEAEAIVRAARTATALHETGEVLPAEAIPSIEPNLTEDAELLQSLATHTVIVAAQQTEMAEPQITITPGD